MSIIGAVGGALSRDFSTTGYSVQGIETKYQFQVTTGSSAAGTIGTIYLDVANTGYGSVTISAILSTCPAPPPNNNVNDAGFLYRLSNYSINLGVITLDSSNDISEGGSPAVSFPDPTITFGSGNTPGELTFTYIGAPYPGLGVSLVLSVITTTNTPANTLVI